jgi:PRTRC genetic system protein A
MFVNHQVCHGALPPIGAFLYEYVLASNGVFVRAQRPEFEAQPLIGHVYNPVRGLPELNPAVSMRTELVPAGLVAAMCLRAYKAAPREILFYLAQRDGWKLRIPLQHQSAGSVIAVNPFSGGVDTAIEVHSHHSMRAFFSSTDNKEEQVGFRIYAVLGRIDSEQPEIRVRVGIYGHFQEIPANWVFDLPDWMQDVHEVEEIQTEPYYDEVEYAA